MKLYKITDSEDQTAGCRGGTRLQWGANVTHHATETGKTMYTYQLIHACKDPVLAVLLSPMHLDYLRHNGHMWECEGTVTAKDSLKVGCKSLTTVRRIEVPVITTEQRVRFAILCALEVYDNTAFVTWANNWLDGRDRTHAAASTARAAAYAAAYAADDVARVAADDARVAYYATYSAYYADNVAYVSDMAARAAADAARANKHIDRVKLVHKAMGEV